MAWFFKKSNSTDDTRSLKDLTADERFELEQSLSDGASISEVARDFGVSPSSLYHIKRAVRGESPTTTAVRAVGDSELERIRREIERVRATAELDKAKADAEYERERRELDLEAKRLDIEEKRRELYGDDDDDFDPSGITDDPIESQLIAFFRDIARKNQMPTPSPAPPTPRSAPEKLDLTKDQTKERIQREISETVSDDDMRRVKSLPVETVTNFLKNKYPGITENNISLILEEIRHYGQQ